MTGPRRTNERGARPLGDDGEDRGKGWLWWLLGLLLLALIAIALISLLGGDDDDGDDSTTPTTSVTSEVGGPTPTDSGGTSSGPEAGQADSGHAASTEAGGSAGGGSAGGSGKLTSEGTSLLPIPSGGLKPYSGKPATGKSVAVESVVSDEGFWVGESEEERVFVKLEIQGESPFKVKAGDVVDLQGKVTALSGGAEALGLTKAEGGDQLSSQGQYLTVTKLARG